MSINRKISYRTAGTGSYTALCDETASPPDILHGNLPALQQTTQVEQLYGSETPFVAGRGNRAWRWRFAVSSNHSTAEAAAAFLQSQPAAIPDNVDLKFEQGATVIYLAAASFAEFDPGEQNGLATTVTYTFIGTNWTTTTP